MGCPPFPESIVIVVRGLHPLAVLPPRDHEREANFGANLVKRKAEEPGMQGGPAERAPLTLNLFDLLRLGQRLETLIGKERAGFCGMAMHGASEGLQAGLTLGWDSFGFD